MTATPSLDIAGFEIAHTGPETPAGRYLRRFWLPVAMLDDVAPVRAKPLLVLNERFTYYRGASGEPYLVGFYCAHRSTQMSTGWVEGEELRCFYHGWKYTGMGQCIEQPAEGDAFAAKVAIEGYPVRAYLGFVYAYLGPGEPPPFPHVRALEGAGHVESRSFVRHSNYWNGLENACDQVHINFAHRNSRYHATGVIRELPQIDAEETAYGILRDVRFSDGKRRIAHTLMPVGSLISTWDRQAGWVQHLSYRIPIDDASHVSFTADLIPLAGDALAQWEAARDERSAQLAALAPYDEVVRGSLDGTVNLHELDRADIVNVQDDVALAAQPPVGSRPSDRLGRSDIQIIILRRIYARELRALAAGQPLTEWRIPDDLAGTAGA
jgi:5,5'-dehydrodivanillate O-demethylase oxygenase subunit